MTIIRLCTVGDSVSPADCAIFLAGPIERVDPLALQRQLPCWRVEVQMMLARSFEEDLVLYSPEWHSKPHGWSYDMQVKWELEAMQAAAVILCWIPRQLPLLPGFTTNVEVGEWLHSPKLLAGAPPTAPHTKYIKTRLTTLCRPWYTDLGKLVADAVWFSTEVRRSREENF
jgi:hypothetical protein